MQSPMWWNLTIPGFDPTLSKSEEHFDNLHLNVDDTPELV